ncbi:hypothetical protein [Yoonia sp. 2307UL14-13]|uniref:hypothetical protein n=1 Tax=Yoonia sp. 2307UL14-13 TaxID=3126506 RepID=UPI0030B28A40
MPLQNRVLPTGEIIAHPARGTYTGNRGIIHRQDRTLGTSRWSHKHWLICTLTHPRGVYHGPMPDRGWSALFFLDEAVALTAGHRPCHYCRRDAYRAFQSAWAQATDAQPERMAIDTTLHKSRVTRTRQQIRHEASIETLPNAAFVLINETAHLVHDGQAFPFTHDGYEPPRDAPKGRVTVLTPKPTVAVLRSGYRPVIHASAGL